MKLKMIAGVLALYPLVAMGVVKTEAVDYKDGDTQLQGFMVYDDAITGKRPGVVVYPEWWGLTEYPKHRAEMLAKLGYVAFAADMYGKGLTTEDPKQATEWMTPIKGDRNVMRRRAMLAIDEIKKYDRVDSEKLAAIGYCFGGTCVLELARMGADLKGVVSFHGGLDAPMPAEEGKVKAKVLALTGGADPTEPPDKIEEFAREMSDAKVDWQINVYHDAKHAFTNPKADSFNLPMIGYNKEADVRSWNAMKAFFTELFGRVTPAGK
ncbi:MAG TPA: dienelactone hydrolase family protein [Tepidisphaeraceae bacterium]|jgi:dienelactone hydrolase|nr:dienelactone hydrolase family protein [Tepidisphaeraceae bacterium]